jgi:serine protease Do
MFIPSRRYGVLCSRWLCAVLLTIPVAAQTQPRGPGIQALRQMSSDFEALAGKVSPAVVKVLVTGYGPIGESDSRDAALVGRQRSIGSGAIVDPNGYIVTNAHVVEGAIRVQVVLTPPRDGENSPVAARPRTLNARIAGVDKETDLAILRVDASGLPTLPVADYRKLRQGQLVLAFGSPEGLEDSVTMGVVSSVMRQPDPDKPLIYIQTDAAVNPGNSGGPLVDVDGNLVGINTFILSESGGNEGLGFAIPSVIVEFVYREILAHGHVHTPTIGARLQTITPALAAGLKLLRDTGLVVADVDSDSPAEKAGLEVQDVLLTLDGVPLDTLPRFQTTLFRRTHGGPVSIEVLRGAQKLSVSVPIVEERQSDLDDLAGLVKPETSLVQGLGIMGVAITGKIAELVEDLRIGSGILVVAQAAGAGVNPGLHSGDIIHSLNGTSISTLEGLRTAVKDIKPGGAAAMQVERDGKLMYLAFEVE